MPTSYTNIAKPSNTNYTNQNVIGKEQYDETAIEYDSSTVFYDGTNQSLWTNIAKPSFTATWNSLAVTWDSLNNPWGSPSWTVINKP